MTLQHAIPLSSKGQILNADYDTRRQERLLHHLRPDLLDLTPGITDLLFCCSEGKELLQYSLDASAIETEFARTPQGNLPCKNIFTWKPNLAPQKSHTTKQNHEVLLLVFYSFPTWKINITHCQC